MAQSEYNKQYKKDHPDRVKQWNTKYQEKHKEELKQKRQAKTRQRQDATLISLVTEYVEGAELKDLCDRYKVYKRKEN